MNSCFLGKNHDLNLKSEIIYEKKRDNFSFVAFSVAISAVNDYTNHPKMAPDDVKIGKRLNPDSAASRSTRLKLLKPGDFCYLCIKDKRIATWQKQS